jgi:hypothetical protein
MRRSKLDGCLLRPTLTTPALKFGLAGSVYFRSVPSRAWPEGEAPLSRSRDRRMVAHWDACRGSPCVYRLFSGNKMLDVHN